MVYLAGAQQARGMSVAVVTNCDGLLSGSCEQEGIPAFVVADSLLGGEVAPEVGSFAQGMAHRLKDFSPEIIHCHDLFTVKAVVATASRLKVPCVITVHTGMRPMVFELAAAKKLAVIVVFKDEFEAMRKVGAANIDFHYVPNGSRASSGAQQAPGASGRPNLMLVGNLGFRKGIDLAILAMVELHRRHGSACPVFNIYGTGELAGYFIEMASMLGLSDLVRFHGVQMDILNKCPSSDVLVVPSRIETGPLVVVEAMSRGIPAVACSVGEVAEMLPDHRYGRVVPVNSIIAFADAVDSMLADIESGQFDPGFLVDRYKTQYSIEKMADRVQAVYESAALGGD